MTSAIPVKNSPVFVQNLKQEEILISVLRENTVSPLYKNTLLLVQNLKPAGIGNRNTVYIIDHFVIFCVYDTSPGIGDLNGSEAVSNG